ncbi:MAG: cyclic nucleotide-binding domain-containing protein [Mariprofundaceae bacterium]|nr:cyclic nucleotide-binding domain-containing protein [Mariprofundaceae bacterium]
MEIDFEWLEDHVFHRQLDAGEQNVLAQSIHVSEFNKGDVLIEEGEHSDGLYLLYSGRAGVLRDSHGEKVRVSEVGEGAQLGDMAIFDDEPSSATITALGACVAYKLSRQALGNLMADHPDMTRDIMMNTIRQLAKIIRGMNSTNAYTQQYIYGRRV